MIPFMRCLPNALYPLDEDRDLDRLVIEVFTIASDVVETLNSAQFA